VKGLSRNASPSQRLARRSISASALAQVCDQQIDAVTVAQDRHRLGSSRCFEDAVTLRLEDPPFHLANGSFVVHDQDDRFGCHDAAAR
jgi:hypothetical protein